MNPYKNDKVTQQMNGQKNRNRQVTKEDIKMAVMPMKWYSISLAISEMQIKATRKHDQHTIQRQVEL